MGYTKNKYQTTGEFFKDVKRGIEDIALRLDEVEKRQDDITAGGIQQVLDDEPVEDGATVQPFQYEGPFAVISDHDGYASNTPGTYYTIQVGSGGGSSGADMHHYVGVIISSGAINLNNRRIPVKGFGYISSASTYTYMIPDDYDLYLQIPAVKRGKPQFDSPYLEDVWEGMWEAGYSAHYSYIVASNGINPAYADWYESTIESGGSIGSSSIKGKYEYIMIAQNRGGKLIQTQFGEITDVPQDYVPGIASSAYRAGYATNAGYKGPFYVKRVGSGGYTDSTLSVWSTWVNVYDNTNWMDENQEITSTNIPYAGHIVQGGTHTVVPGAYHLPVMHPIDHLTGDITPCNLYLYKDEEDVSSPYKFSAVASGATENPFSSFYTRLAFVDGLGGIQQTQFGDIVDVEVGGSTVINSSSIYSSTYVDSRYIDSRTYNTTSTYVTSTTIISSGGMEYKGAFIVSGGLSSGETSDVFLASCYDGQGRQYGGHDIAGYVIAGNMRHPVYISSGFPLIDGAKVYLIGKPNRIRHSATYEISAMTGTPPNADTQWYTQLAYKEGGIVYQTQFGDIVAPYEVPYASSSFRASNGGVQAVSAGNSNVTVNPTSGTVYVSAVGGGGSGGGTTGGMMFPNYAALAGGTGGITINPSTGGTSSSGAGYVANADGWLRISIKNGNGYNGGCFRLMLNGTAADIGMFNYMPYAGGMTAIIPIQSGTSISYTAPTADNLVVFAPSVAGGVPFPIYTRLTSNSDDGGHRISAGETYNTPYDGWVRVSILNNTATAGCVTVNIGGVNLGMFQCRTSAGGVTQMFPVPASTGISYTAPSNCSCLVKFDH